MNPWVNVRFNSAFPKLARLLIYSLLAVAAPAFADRFGDIAVTSITLANGTTFHGYHEYRFLLENHSSKTTRKVTLILPDRSYTSGNSISRLTRTVTLGPSSQAMVPLWQPPLPIAGNNQLRVQVDDEDVGAVTLPDPSRHLTTGLRFRGAYTGGGATDPTAILVSRSLNFDDLNKLLNPKSVAGDYSAQMATGAPDSPYGSGHTSTAWMPSPSSGGPHWLEVDFPTPQPAQGLQVYYTLQNPATSDIYVIGVSGTNLVHQHITLPRSPSTRRHVISFPVTSEPVKSVRIEFGMVAPSLLSVDTVGLVGSSTNVMWPSAARASSEATSFYGTTPTSAPSHTLLRSELPIAEWSDAWLSYTPYDAVALTATDLRTLPPAAFNALWSYVEAGGNVFVFGGTALPGPWQAFPRTTLQNGEDRMIGLGHCFASDSSALGSLPDATVKYLTEAAQQTSRYWQTLPSVDTINQSFPVVENYRVPVHSTVVIMLLFVIIIGPVNLIVLSRMNRRTWLLWTIPAISLFTCVTVFAYSFIREGVTPNTRIAGITILDQANRRAASVGYTAFYCPLTPSQGLNFSSDTEATPLVQTDTYGRASGNSREMDWTQGQHLGRGWVSARVPAHFLLRKTETRRERLEIETHDGHSTIVNGLGATIKTLWFADSQSRIYTATNIVAGQKTALVATGEVLKGDQKFGARGLLEKAGAQADVPDGTPYLQPGTYVADLDANPFFENGLGAKAVPARTKSRAVVFGTLEPPTKP